MTFKNLRGQYYDGAAVIRGSYSDVQARIQKENLLALYVHCYVYLLNLCGFIKTGDICKEHI